MVKSNMTLLSQKEIDALLKFLIEKKDDVSGDVLDQASIDKLIQIIKFGKLLAGDMYHSNIDGESTFKNKNYKLTYIIDPDTNFIKLNALNEVTGETIPISPKSVEEKKLLNDDSEWGYSITPATFDYVSSCFQIKYTKETFLAVKQLFALKNFGHINYDLPEIYLPEEDTNKSNMLITE